MRILIVKLSAVGDVVHALPVLHALRTARPDAHIAWAVHGRAAYLLEGHPELDELIVVPRPRLSGGIDPLRDIFSRLRAGGGWDAAIDLQGLTKSGAVALASGAKIRIGFAGPAGREINQLFMTERVLPTSRSVIAMNLELLSALGIDPAPAIAAPIAWLHTTPDDERYASEWVQREGLTDSRLLLLDPFAGWETKLWEPDKWVNVARRAQNDFDLRPIIFFGPKEGPHAAALAERMNSAGAHALPGPDTTLRQYTALLKNHIAAMVGADTGPMHMAAASGVPTLALFGPSDPARNAPLFAGAKFETLQDPAQPCANTFTRECTYHAPGMCMAGITPDAVVEALARLVGRETTSSS